MAFILILPGFEAPGKLLALPFVPCGGCVNVGAQKSEHLHPVPADPPGHAPSQCPGASGRVWPHHCAADEHQGCHGDLRPSHNVKKSGCSSKHVSSMENEEPTGLRVHWAHWWLSQTEFEFPSFSRCPYRSTPSWKKMAVGSPGLPPLHLLEARDGILMAVPWGNGGKGPEHAALMKECAPLAAGALVGAMGFVCSICDAVNDWKITTTISHGSLKARPPNAVDNMIKSMYVTINSPAGLSTKEMGGRWTKKWQARIMQQNGPDTAGTINFNLTLN